MSDLNTLKRIVQEVDACSSLKEALELVVQEVCATMGTDGCSIFLVDYERGEIILVATQGLNPNFLGGVRLHLGEGLIGYICERAEPVNLENALAHPKFKHYPGLGEEKFRALLGAPLIHQRKVLGVLVAHQAEMRRFDESEEAFLITLSAQLSGIVAHDLAIGGIKKFRLEETKKTENELIEGLSGSPGIAIGTALVVYPLADLSAVPERKAEDLAEEQKAIESAISETKNHLSHLTTHLQTDLPEEERDLFNVYLRMLSSQNLLQDIYQELATGWNAETALKHVIFRYIKRFQAMEDPYLQERATDIKALGERLLFHLQSKEQNEIEYPKKTILVGEEIAATTLAEVPEGRLAGVISMRGSSNSHVAILARALGVPTVMGIEGVDFREWDGLELIVDGYFGHIYVSPKVSLRTEFLNLIRQERQLDRDLENLRDLPATTLDEKTIHLAINTGLASDVKRASSVGAEAVGLYRTEVPFMMRERFPTEEEQRVIYRQMLQAFAPKIVTMRTLDIGGDKALSYFPIKEDNPFLGWRGIRISLDHPEIFLVQIRAMLKASLGLNNLQIMLPLVSSVTEMEGGMTYLKQAYEELQAEHPELQMPGIGVMIEVPAAVYQAQLLAKRVDFLSVGSNDLTQYLLAVDRNNPRVSNLYDNLHPAVLRALMQVVAGAHRENKTVSICGEMAADPASAIILLAMGFDMFSMNPNSLPRIKWVVRSFNLKRAKELLEEVLSMEDPLEIRGHLEAALDEAGLGGLIRAGQ